MAPKSEMLVRVNRTPEQIRADLDRARAELATSVEALKREAQRAVDWRQWYRKHTGLFILGAFTVGFIIGSRRRQ